MVTGSSCSWSTILRSPRPLNSVISGLLNGLTRMNSPFLYTTGSAAMSPKAVSGDHQKGMNLFDQMPSYTKMSILLQLSRRSTASLVRTLAIPGADPVLVRQASPASLNS